MATKRIKIEDLRAFCAAALEKNGMDREPAGITAKVLTWTDAWGTYTHGTKNLHNYIKKSRAGGMNLNAPVTVLREGPAYALLDGGHGIGMVSACKAMETAITKAASSGIAMAVVKNGCHFGAAGYYANMAAAKNMAGLVLSNVDPNMGAPGARGKVLGNNPLSYAVPKSPAKSPGTSIFLDIAMSTVASLKVIQARKDQKPVPDTWITDAAGLPTTDPGGYPEEGAMQPMAGHKGFGLALMTEILTGVISGGGIMNEIPSWLFSMEEKNNVSYTFIAVDISKFMAVELFLERIDDMVAALHNAPEAEGSQGVRYPGELGWKRAAAAEKTGIPLPEDVVLSLTGLEEESGIPIKWAE